MTKAVLGIIGGSGLYELPGLEKVREERIDSPWGEPSAPLRIGGQEVLKNATVDLVAGHRQVVARADFGDLIEVAPAFGEKEAKAEFAQLLAV